MWLLVKYFLFVGSLGFTRLIQDYSSGPGTPLAHKIGMGWVGACWRFLLRVGDCYQPA